MGYFIFSSLTQQFFETAINHENTKFEEIILMSSMIFCICNQKYNEKKYYLVFISDKQTNRKINTFKGMIHFE